jgi:hypothetical protein
VLAEHGTPHLPQPGQIGGVDDPIVGAGLQVDGRARGEIARERPTSSRELEHLSGEGGQDHVSDRRLQRAADEPPAQRLEREFAHAVRLHAGLFEQPPVDRQLPVCRVVGLGELDVVLDRPALGVLGVECLVQRDTEAAEDRALLELQCGDRVPRPEQRVRVEVDRARVDLDVARVRQAGADQSPYRVQALKRLRPVLGEVLEDRVEAATLRGRAV